MLVEVSLLDGEPATSALRIALVDDDPTMLGILTRLVRPHPVTATERPTVLLDLIRQGVRFDVIVSDLMMPEMTGAVLYREVCAIDPAQGARMIIVTGGAMTSDTLDFIQSTDRPVVAKPFDRTVLRALIDRVGRP